MKVSIFNGTPRPNGNTARLTMMLGNGLAREGCDVQEYMIDGCDIRGCRNCGACQKDRVEFCALDDGMTPLYRSFVDSDIVIIASPIYMWGITAPTKAFMDRLHCLCREGSNRMAGKKLAFVTTMGDEEIVAASASNAIQFFCQYYGITYMGTFAVPFASQEEVCSETNTARLKAFIERLTG